MAPIDRRDRPCRGGRRRAVRSVAPLAPLLLVVAMLASGVSAGVPPVASATALEHPGSVAVRQAPVGPVRAAVASLQGGSGPGAGRSWTCTDASEAAARCSASPAGGSTGGWSPATVAADPDLVQGLFVYDAHEGYDLLMSPNSTVWDDRPAGASPLYSTFQNGSWSSIAIHGGPSFYEGASLLYDSTDGYVLYYVPSTFGSGTPQPQTWSFAGGTWTNRTTPVVPTSGSAVLSDDPAVSGVLLFGAERVAYTSSVGDVTWAYAAGTWTNLTGTLSANAKNEVVGTMTYDSADHGVLFVGGPNASSYWTSYDTWFFNGSWHAEPAVPLPTTYNRKLPWPPALADDPADGYVVMVTSWNGTNSTGPSWHYHNGSWSAGPTQDGLVETSFPSLVYDAGRGQVLLVEWAYASIGYTTMWAFDASAWTNLSATWLGPGPRADLGMAYDAADGYVVAFGGCDCRANGGFTGVSSQTWSFQAGEWSQLATNTSPPARTLADLVYDASDGYVLMFGGQGNGVDYNDTWEFTNGGWTEITPQTAPPWPGAGGDTMAYDAADNYVVLVTGAFPGATWTYHAGVWTDRTALGDRTVDGAPVNPLVYDSTLGRVVLFGTAHTVPGLSPMILADTWEFLAGNWTNVTPSVGPAPSARADAAVADFPPGDSVVLYGGSRGWGGVSAPLNDTWAFANGTWTELSSARSPGNRSDMTGTYDPDAHADLFFGGWGNPTSSGPRVCVASPCSDSWFWSGGGPRAPIVESFAAVPPAIDLGASTEFSVTVVGGTAPLTYAYANLPTGCASANASRLACTPGATGRWTVEVNATDALGDSATASTTVSVAAAVSVSAFFATPGAPDVGERTLLSVQLLGGTGPYTFSYSGLPQGCSSQDVPTLPCAPAQSGTFAVGVTVSDAGGGRTNASLTLAVRAAGGSGTLRIQSFALVPSTLVLGNSTMVELNATSSSPPLTYSYGGLPPGCGTVNASNLSCRPTGAGTFGITLLVQDAAGDVASVVANLTVDPVGGGAGLTIVGFGASPGLVTVGTAVVLSVSVLGGSGALTFRYPVLPSGCTSANTPALACAPNASGTFPLYVVVSDAVGQSQGAEGRLDVIGSSGPGPAVAAFFASPANGTVGHPLTFVAEARGTLPITYSYGGLPPGCAGADAPVFNCTPTEAGTFAVTVNIRDAEGRLASANTTVLVAPAPQLPTGPSKTASSPFWSGADSVLVWALLGGVVGSVLAYGLLEAALTRRRERVEGEAIVRELSRPSADEPDAPDRP